MQQVDDTPNKLSEILADLERTAETQNLQGEDLIPWVIELALIGTTERIRLPVKEQILLGRSSQQGKLELDVDFLAYNAQAQGVSRKHACLSMKDKRLMIEDLGSTNGTYVNGNRILAQQAVRLHNADKIRLGHLELQVQFLLQPHEIDKILAYAGKNLKVPRIARAQRLLILDDDKAICTILRMIAMQAGFQVTVCHELSAAIAHWDTGMIDAIFLEIFLEEGSGLTFIHYLRQQGKKTVPIIATVNTAGAYQEAQARESGVNALLVKPLAAKQIIDAFVAISSLLPKQ